jgi:hypothetical protein
MLGSSESKTNEIMEKIVRDADKMTVKEAVINNLLLSNTIYNESAARMGAITDKIEKVNAKVGDDINEIKGAIIQLTGLATKVEKIVEDNEVTKKEVLKMIAAIQSDMNKKISFVEESTDQRLDGVEKTNIRYGVYMKILGVIGVSIVGAIVAQFFDLI